MSLEVSPEEQSIIRSLEHDARVTWPTGESIEFDGWLLGHSHGFSRRTNSVHVLAQGRQPMNQKLPAVESWYGARSRPAYFKITDADLGLDAFLERRGYTAEGLTQVQVADLHGASHEDSTGAAASVDEWIDAFLAVRDPLDEEDAAAFAGIVRAIEGPVHLAVATVNGTPVSVALGVANETSVGIFNVVTSTVHRRQGHGRRVTASVLAWGQARGAGTAFLQVVEENEGALRMFQSLGFSTRYRYRYRRQPGR